MFTGKKRVFLTATLIFLLTFAFVSSASAHTTVNWTVKYNGQEVPGNYVYKGPGGLYKIQIPFWLGTAGKNCFYYTFTCSRLPKADLKPVPDAAVQPLHGCTWPTGPNPITARNPSTANPITAETRSTVAACRSKPSHNLKTRSVATAG